MKPIVIRCDADNGDKVGHGHAMRCFALAQAIKAKGTNPIFLMGETTEFISMLLHNEDILCILINGNGDDASHAAQTVGVSRSFEAEQIVVDGYELSVGYLAMLAGAGFNVVAVDDKKTPMFRQDIWKARKRSFRAKQEIKRVFVRIEDNFSETVDEALSELGLKRVEPGGDKIIDNMFSSDIAISAGGITAWELALFGIPSLLVTDAPQQTINCMNLNRTGAALNLGWTKDMLAERIVRNIKSIERQPKRAQMSAAGKRAVRENGTEYYLKKLGLA